MSDPVLVVPFNVNLLSHIDRRKVLVRTTSPAAIDDIKNITSKHNHLVCIHLESPGALTDLPLSESWIGIPIVTHVLKLGDIARIVEKLPTLRNLSIKVFFSSQMPNSFRETRILSSLMVASGIVLDHKNLDWASLNDLMHYAIYGRVKHAPIEPFYYIISHYSPTGLTDFRTIYLENPSHFLHCNENGQIALSQANLSKNEFITTLKDLDSFLANESLLKLTGWEHKFFSHQNTECTSCPAWRVCLGTFESSHRNNHECKEFFSDLMDAAEYVQEKEKKNPTLWQP